MFEYLKHSKNLKSKRVLKEAKTIDYDKDGRAQIFVGLPESDNFFSEYSYLTYEFMNPGVVEYINMCEANIPIKDDISLEITTETDTSNAEKIRIREAVKRHHAEQIVHLKKKLKRKVVSGSICFSIGMILLFLEIFFHISSIAGVGILLDVAGWVFAWDGLEILIGENSSLRRQLTRSFRLFNAKVHVRKYSRKIQKKYKIGDFDEDEDDE